VVLAWFIPVVSNLTGELASGARIVWFDTIVAPLLFLGPLNLFTFVILALVMRDWKRHVHSAWSRGVQRALKVVVILALPFALMGARGLAWYLLLGVGVGAAAYIALRPLYAPREDMV
jgi:hypothetical protein